MFAFKVKLIVMPDVQLKTRLSFLVFSASFKKKNFHCNFLVFGLRIAFYEVTTFLKD